MITSLSHQSLLRWLVATWVYNEKADIFSLGMLLYELATEGKQPFSDLKFRNEFDEAVITGRPIDPIIVADAPPWPYMQELLDHMLVTEPEDRPTAEQVRKLLAVWEERHFGFVSNSLDNKDRVRQYNRYLPSHRFTRDWATPSLSRWSKTLQCVKARPWSCMTTRYFRDGGVGGKWRSGSGVEPQIGQIRRMTVTRTRIRHSCPRVDLSSTKPTVSGSTSLQAEQGLLLHV